MSTITTSRETDKRAGINASSAKTWEAGTQVLDDRTTSRLVTEAVYALPKMIGVPKQLWSPSAKKSYGDFVKTYGVAAPPSPLRRFMNGEFTNGKLPFHTRRIGHHRIEALLRVMDIIGMMARLADKPPEKVEKKKSVPRKGDSIMHAIEDTSVSIQDTIAELGLKMPGVRVETDGEGAVVDPEHITLPRKKKKK